MASFLQPVYNAIGLGDADLRAKVFYVTGFIASVSVIHFFGMYPFLPSQSMQSIAENLTY